MKNFMPMLLGLACSIHFTFSQTDESWIADGVGNTYDKLHTLTGARPQVPCGHDGFTDKAHIDEVLDATLSKYVYRFTVHADEDGNYRQCNPNEVKERQRNELAYNTLKPTQKVKYTWLLKIPENFTTTSSFSYNFCHLHQIKLRNGVFNSQPMFTLSAFRDQLMVITSTTDFNGDRVLHSRPLSEFKGKWVEVTEIIYYEQSASQGRYGISIKELSNGTELFHFVDNDIQSWKGGATELQVKWGIYRSRTTFGGGQVFTDLNDEMILYDNFRINYLADNDPIDFNETTDNFRLTTFATNGSVSANPEADGGIYAEGTTVQLAATPDSGYAFVRWEGDLTGTDNPATLTMDADKNVTAIFEPLPPTQYRLAINTTNGSVSVNPETEDGVYDEGTTVQLTATPDSGYAFIRWEGDLTGTDNPATLTMDADKNVTAIFEPLPPTQYRLAINATNGSVSANPAAEDGAYDEGTTVQLTAMPDSGYEFTRWEGDLTGTDNPATLTMDADKNVTAVFEPLPPTQYRLAINTTNGSVSVNPETEDGVYDEGTTVQLTATPDSGYAFIRWEGDLTGTDNPATLTMDADKNVTAIFEPLPPTQYRLTINASSGSVSANPEAEDGAYDEGTTVQLTAMPDSGYAFVRWEGDLTGTDNPATLTMDADKNVTAVFEPLPPTQYRLTINASSGSVSANPEAEDGVYDEGTAVQLTATPDSGYAFIRWEGDLTGTGNPAVITMDSDKNVTAIFEPLPPTQYRLTINASSGSVSANPEAEDRVYDEGTAVQLTATPDSGYAFIRWEGDLTGTDNPISIIIDQDKNIEVIFEETIEVLEPTEIIISINQTEALVTITTPEEKKLAVASVFGLGGKLLFQTKESIFGLAQFPPGIYIVEIVSVDGSIGIKKILLR